MQMTFFRKKKKHTSFTAIFVCEVYSNDAYVPIGFGYSKSDDTLLGEKIVFSFNIPSASRGKRKITYAVVGSVATVTITYSKIWDCASLIPFIQVPSSTTLLEREKDNGLGISLKKISNIMEYKL